MSRLSRRRALAAASTVLAAGCLRLDDSDDSGSQTSSEAPAAWNWLPRPDEVTGDSILPFHAIQPGSEPTVSETYREPIRAFPRALLPGGEELSIELEDVETGVAAARLRVATGAFDTDVLAGELSDAGLTENRDIEGHTVYATDRTAVALSGDSIAVGRHTPQREPTVIVESALQAAHGSGDRYVDADPAAGVFLDVVGDADFAFWRPVDSVNAVDPSAGRFANELGYGTVATFGETSASVEYRRAFSTAPATESIQSWATDWESLPDAAVPDVEGDSVSIPFEVSASDLTVLDLAPRLRSQDGIKRAVDVELGERVGDPVADDVDVTIYALQFLFRFGTDDGRVQELGPLRPNTTLTVSLRSLDTVHGCWLQPVGVERLITPGERRTFEVPVGDTPLTIRGSRYSGAGHHAMNQPLPVDE